MSDPQITGNLYHQTIFPSDIKNYTPTLCRYGNIAMVTLSWYMISLSTKNDPVKILLVKSIPVGQSDRLIKIASISI